MEIEQYAEKPHMPADRSASASVLPRRMFLFCKMRMDCVARIVAMCAMLSAVSCSFADDFKVSAWRGETLSVLVPDYTELGEPPAGLDVRCGVLRPVRYRPVPSELQIAECYDIVDWSTSIGGAPRIAEIKVPHTARPGLYKWGLMDIEVIDRELPPPSEWKYYLDFWQHPWAVARYAKVKPFSKAHYAAMRPLWELLATAGQKVLSVTLVDRPWNHQCRDAYGTMVEARKDASGKLSFDYAIFDEYVAFGRSCGIGPHIACYSICPWGERVGWTDANGKKIVARAKPGTKEFEDFWGPFLDSFAAHLKAKGWFADTYMAMDERAPEDVKLIVDFVHTHAPGMKISLAGNRKPSEFVGITLDNYSQYIGRMTDDFFAEVTERRAKGYITTYYMLGSRTTNIGGPISRYFWLGAYPEMVGLDGMLRWAYNSWPEDPFVDASFRYTWQAGAVYIAYPGGVPSYRFLELRNGIIAAEKIRILKEKGLFRDEIAALSKRYSYDSDWRTGKTNLAKLKEETLKLVNR